MTPQEDARRRSAAPAVDLRGITKSYGSLVANDGVDLAVMPGEVHGLLGENGAGKSTLMKVLFGLTVPDSGSIEVGGRPVTIRRPADALSHGVGMVTQHFSLVRPFTVAENITLGAPGVRLDSKATERRVTELSRRLGIPVDPTRRVESLSVGECQRVEILKAMSRDCRVLVLDEPTAVLVPHEVEALFDSLRRLREAGMGVVLITHKLHEVRALCDRVTVLRRGRSVATVRPDTVDDDELVRLMVGADTDRLVRHRRPETARAEVLCIEGLDVAGHHGRPAVLGASLTVGRGEIVGIAGVSGNGQSELMEALNGIRRPTAGSVLLDGVDITNASPGGRTRLGIGRIAEDRFRAVIPELSVALNLALENLRRFRRRGRLDGRAITRHAVDLIERFSIKASPGDLVGTLSGGNVQKVVLARALEPDPRLLLVSQPTRGLDIGATQFVRSQIVAQRERGCAVLLVSEDLDELLLLADRILVMRGGRIVAERVASEVGALELGALMVGELIPA